MTSTKKVENDASLRLYAVVVRDDTPDLKEPYAVWFTAEHRPFPEGFVAGRFVSFDAAVAALLAITGLRVVHVRSEVAMKPQVFARRFVARVVREMFRDFLDFTEPQERNPDLPAPPPGTTYADVEACVRDRFAVTGDLRALARAVHDAAPESHRDAVVAALDAYVEGQVDETTVKQQAAYVVGVAVGGMLRRRVVKKVGEG